MRNVNNISLFARVVFKRVLRGFGGESVPDVITRLLTIVWENPAHPNQIVKHLYIYALNEITIFI